MARADALVHAAQQIGWDQPADRQAATLPREAGEPEIPQIDSPPLAVGPAAQDWTEQAPDDAPAPSRPALARRANPRRFAFGSGPARSLSFSPPMAIAAMAALVLALIVWRNDVVRLLPQTAAFFQLTGLGVNLRNLAFEDVRVSTEMVNGGKVFVIEGAIAPTSRKPIEVPRLRFVVQDEHGADIYAWNSVVEQAVVKPGERVAFKSRLASPPSNAHSVTVRFFHPRDLASGSI